MNFNFRGPFGGHPWRPKIEKQNSGSVNRRGTSSSISMSSFIMIRRKLPKPFLMGAQKFMGAQKLLRDHDASASLRHPQMAPARIVSAGAADVRNGGGWQMSEHLAPGAVQLPVAESTPLGAAGKH